MRESVVRGAGLIGSAIYAAIIAWLFVNQPQTVAQATGGLASVIGAYSIDRQSFDDGLRFFRHDQFVEARAALNRADPAARDPVTQFYIAYTFYREGWGRMYSDAALYARGLDVVDKAIAAAPDGRIVVADPNLEMHSADELRAELERGTTRGMANLNPLRLLRTRK
jgi:hypothetical protein